MLKRVFEEQYKTEQETGGKKTVAVPREKEEISATPFPHAKGVQSPHDTDCHYRNKPYPVTLRAVDTLGIRASFLMKKIYGIFLLVCLFVFKPHSSAFCEEAITEFDGKFAPDWKFAINLFGNYNIGIFMQDDTQGFRTDEPWRIGLGFRYKKFAASFSVPINFKFNSFDVELNSYFEKLYFESYLKRYQGYYDYEAIEKKNVGLDIMSAGVTAGWIHNNQNHSLSSVYALDEKQNISSGSFLYGAGVYYTSLYSDNTGIKHYDERNHIIHFGPHAGYSYTWVLPHDMFVNINTSIGANLGISVTENKVLFIPQIKPKISFGHHNRTWSINAVMGSNAAVLLWDANNFDVLSPSTMTVTFSMRF